MIAVQMLFGTPLIDTAHASFENRIIAFDGVGMNAAGAHVFLFGMIDSLMRGEPYFGFQVAIPACGIGHHGAFAHNVGANDRDKISNRGSFDMKAASRTAALNESKDSVFVRRMTAAPLFAGAHDAIEFPNESFVGQCHRVRP